MKNLVLTIAIAALTFTSCSKDESFTPTPNTSEQVYVVNIDNPVNAFTAFAPENMTMDPILPNNLFAETSGLRSPGPNQPGHEPVTLTWSGLQDDTGIYGTAELNAENSNYTIHITMKTECIFVQGNKATYGGVIMEVTELSGDTPPLEPGWKFYFQVADLDHGYESGDDRISNTYIFASPVFESLCSLYTPNHSIWMENGQQKVSNPGYVFVSAHPE